MRKGKEKKKGAIVPREHEVAINLLPLDRRAERLPLIILDALQPQSRLQLHRLVELQP